jgi:AbrB family looped-hinge helix DNA binding protein
MSETLVVSSRGQITLPAALRKRLGIRSGDVVILEERGNEVILKPGMVLEVQHYSDEQIAHWDTEDRLSNHQRTQIINKLATQKK